MAMASTITTPNSALPTTQRRISGLPAGLAQNVFGDRECAAPAGSLCVPRGRTAIAV